VQVYVPGLRSSALAEAGSVFPAADSPTTLPCESLHVMCDAVPPETCDVAVAVMSVNGVSVNCTVLLSQVLVLSIVTVFDVVSI
jgi:hypothetical protein